MRKRKTRTGSKFADATINRGLQALRAAFNLARKEDRLARVPFVPLLRESNARTGFFERAEFEAVAARLPDPENDIARFAYLTGWRRGEILPLTWADATATARLSCSAIPRTATRGVCRSTRTSPR
jgi:integrase